MAKTLKGVNPALVSGYQQLVAAVEAQGGKIRLESGFRTYEEQAREYNNRANSPYPAAPPGTSRHEKGEAIDISGDAKGMRLAHELAPQFGLAFPVPNDPIHLQLAGGSNQAVPQAPGTEQQKEPMPIVDRFEAIAKTIIGEIPQVVADVQPPGGSVSLPGVVPAPAEGQPVARQDETEPEAAPTGGAAAGAFAEAFNAAGAKYGIDPRLLSAVARAESGYNPEAQSPAGARGLMQFMPGTAAGLDIDPMDPIQAINGAARLLAGYIKQYGSVDLALAAYNAGPGAVQKYNGIPPYKETQNYVKKINGFLGGGNG